MMINGIRFVQIMLTKKRDSASLFASIFRRFLITSEVKMAPAKKTKPEKAPPSIINFLKSPKKVEQLEVKMVAEVSDESETKHQRKRLKKETVEKDEQEDHQFGSPEPDEAETGEKSGKRASNLSGEKVDFAAWDSRPHLFGAHVSSAGGAHNALIEARQIGASSCAFFLRPPKSFNIKPLEDKMVALFEKTATELKFNRDNIVVHAPYLANIGSPNGEALERSRQVLFDDLQRCDRLGIKYYNIHPGSSLNQISAEKCCKLIAESVNMGLKKTKNVVLLLENMAGQGNWVGSNFKELGAIISNVEDKNRIGVCLDTCHAFAYGYGINAAAGLKRLLDDFSTKIGMQYLKAVHVNDSKGACGDNKDRHEDIGKGVIGKAGFKLFMNEPAFIGIPLILETPGGSYDKEIKLLHSMVNGEQNPDIKK